MRSRFADFSGISYVWVETWHGNSSTTMIRVLRGRKYRHIRDGKDAVTDQMMRFISSSEKFFSRLQCTFSVCPSVGVCKGYHSNLQSIFHVLILCGLGLDWMMQFQKHFSNTDRCVTNESLRKLSCKVMSQQEVSRLRGRMSYRESLNCVKSRHSYCSVEETTPRITRVSPIILLYNYQRYPRQLPKCYFDARRR